MSFSNLFVVHYLLWGDLHSEWWSFEPIFSLLYEDGVLASLRAALSVCKMVVILEQEGALENHGSFRN